ncbi:MAG TPA: outer membrane protein [Pseudolabrys sp.]|nr:outer membrane protein [Pseudolabrys sp.]
MKKIIGAAAIVAMTASAAAAADFPRGQTAYYSPAVTSVYNWAGPYIGANLGYQWGRTSNSATRPSGLLGGLQAGYLWQNQQFVFGGETDIQISGADDTVAPFKFANPWFGTLRARGGYAMNNILFYATLGLAYGGMRADNMALSESKSSVGWTAGAGVEVGLTPNWTAKAEYLYIDLASRSFSVTGQNNAISSNLLRFGVNYHF